MTLKFSKIAFQYSPSDVLIMPLKQFSRKESYVIKGVEGLDPPDIDIAVGQKIYEDSVFQGSRPQDREITMMLGLNPNYKAGETYSDLRSRLYAMLAPKFGQDCRFILMDSANKFIAQVAGRVKSIKANPFSRSGDLQIVITCYSAYLIGSRYSLPDPKLQTTNPLAVINEGNAPSGFVLRIYIGAIPVSAASITFSKAATYGEILKFSPVERVKHNDTLIISTETGNKYASLYRPKVGQPADGNLGNYIKYNMLPSISIGSKWFHLHGGVNTLMVKLDDVLTSKYLVESLTFIPKYWGV